MHEYQFNKNIMNCAKVLAYIFHDIRINHGNAD
jgi:hypothetical protein